MKFGKLNHFARTVSLASGVTIDTSATASATHINPQRAQAIALRRSSPSDLSTSQVAPSRT